ncbi:single-stranded-DNA-specific exonuclease RecJ [Parasphaerochaeta coccoides]|uniref:Single-stranded-DNA-specific exonuclease RecJ n=1 Tax=Parasphaerochaeta coccoides (strain ATCC BAA-1237 / DSM 17374 / SPN1) TaxID=760011 RepID=F4GHT8_PARC1|nr:single-stranded-DNA-specific exonuclease RecJ [Parasphaerochaeta coccoides]AEC01626.1 single-stranded-DNA-specific exonuclease RecJ [Parasphaerochaeta coccoides DSM 17374]
MTWEKKRVSTETVGKLHERLGLDVITASILARRGIEEVQDVKFFLENELTFLHNPFHFDDMEVFVERMQQAVEDKEKVRIFGDRDVDGITGTVLLHQEFERLGLDASYKLPEGDEPYGLTMAGVDAAHADGVTLLVTVDCGISNNDEIAYASTLGLDTLVLDHHLGGDVLPPAMAIINPKLEGSGYPFSHLAGCGVAAKCIWALRFSYTDFFREECILLHAQPGNDTVIIRALRLRNMIVDDRISEEVVPGMLPPEKSRLLQFLSAGVPILVLDEEEETSQLRKAFGRGVDIHCVSMRQEMEKVLPQIRGKSIFALTSISRGARYGLLGRDELDALYMLFMAFVMHKEPLLSEDYDSLLDLVAIGTIADLMPMIDENRILVRRGLSVLKSSRRKALQPLMAMQNLIGRSLSTTDISWNLTPLINAAGRMGEPSIAVEMLLSKDAHESERLAGELVQLNKKRQKMGEDVWVRLEPKAKASKESHGGKFLMVEDPSISRGLTGIMASRLLRQFSIPSLVIAKTDDHRVTGSMRSPDDFHVRDFLSQFEDLFLDYGGHARAGGFSMETDNLSGFKDRLMDVVERMDGVDEHGESIRIDCSLPARFMTPDIMKVVEFFEPYGEQNPPIHFMIEGAIISDISSMNNRQGSDHLRLSVSYGSHTWPAVYWQAADKLDREFSLGDSVNVVFRLGRNYFRNTEIVQLTVMDIVRHS